MKATKFGNPDIIALIGNTPLISRFKVGEGTLDVIASNFGISDSAVSKGNIASEVDKPLAKPYPLLAHVREFLHQILHAQMLFNVGDSLSFIACRSDSGKYTIGILNNNWTAQKLAIKSLCGKLYSKHELAIDQSDKNAIGYYPEGIAKDIGSFTSDTTIEGGDIRIFSVHIKENTVSEIPKASPPYERINTFYPFEKYIV